MTTVTKYADGESILGAPDTSCLWGTLTLTCNNISCSFFLPVHNGESPHLENKILKAFFNSSYLVTSVMLFQYLRMTTMLRLAPKHSSSHINGKLFHTTATTLQVPAKDSTETDTVCDSSGRVFQEFYGNDEARWTAEDILGEADVAGKPTIEMDKQILRELLWHIDEEYNTGSGTLEHYLARQKRKADKIREQEMEKREGAGNADTEPQSDH